MASEQTLARKQAVSRRLAGALAVAMLVAHCGLVGWAATRHAPTIDEPPHLAAGISHWKLGRFDLYSVNPPLARMIAAIPVMFAPHKENWAYYARGGLRPEFQVGRDLISANGGQSFRLITFARWACLPFSIVGAAVCWRWASDLYGRSAGLLALCLWCFGPNILAHAELVTPDVAATAMGAAAHYQFWRWLKTPTWSAALFSGVLLGLAEATKATWIILFAAWPLVWPCWRFFARGGVGNRRGALQGLAIVAIGLWVLNATYGFDGSFRRLDEFKFTSEALRGADEGAIGGNRFAGTMLGRPPVPLPASYVLGLDLQRRDFEEPPVRSYLGGNWQKHGWWYFYLYALALKVPVGTWSLMFLAAVVSFKRNGRSGGFRDEAFLLAPAVLVLLVVSSQTGFSHHLRYVLPIAPYCFIWIGKLAKYVTPATPATALLTVGALLWTTVGSLSVYPHSLSYFNELAGGPESGHKYLVNSNIDWGQDLLYLKEGLEKRGMTGPIGLAYFGMFDPRIAGLDHFAPPQIPARRGGRGGADAGAGPLPGRYAISVNMLRGIDFPITDGKGGVIDCRDEPFTYFQRFEPAWKAGHSIYVYELSADEVNRVRQEMGLSRLKSE